jgi:hypothetical protein
MSNKHYAAVHGQTAIRFAWSELLRGCVFWAQFKDERHQGVAALGKFATSSFLHGWKIEEFLSLVINLYYHG